MKRLLLMTLALLTICSSSVFAQAIDFGSATNSYDGLINVNGTDYNYDPGMDLKIFTIENGDGFGKPAGAFFKSPNLLIDGVLINNYLLSFVSASTIRYNQLSGVPSTFAPSTHSHIAADISDSSSVGRSVMTAANGSAARTAIGAGTSNVSLPIAETDVTGLTTDLSKRLIVYSGTTQRSNPVLITKSATTTSGSATFYLTSDNTSTGTALCPTGVETTATNMAVNDSTGMFTYSWAFSNGNKTLTATVKALNLLALGLGNPANGTTVNLTVLCY